MKIKNDWIYCVRWKEGARMRQREFDKKVDADDFLLKLKRNNAGKKLDYEYTRHRFKTKFDKLKETQFRWLGMEVPVLFAGAVLAVVIAGTVFRFLVSP